MFHFAAPRPRRKPSLTPMIDVVFLLLVFFMLAARFGQDFALPLATAGGVTPYDGPPRLIEFTRDTQTLNGIPVPLDRLAAALAPLTESEDDPILIRPRAQADVQAMVNLLDVLRASGFTRLVVVPE